MDTLQDHPIASIFPLLAEPELAELAEDIKANGVQVPIVLFEGKILDGRNRYRAAQSVGAHFVTNHYAGDSPTAHVISLNLKRRQLTSSQRAMVAVDALPHFAAEAKSRMSVGGKGVEIIPPLETGKARDKAAKATGVNGRYVQDAKKLDKEHPDLSADVRNGKTTIPKAKAKAAARKRSIIEIVHSSGVVSDLGKLAGKTFGCIYADPPWKYGNQATRAATSNHYEALTVEQICALPVRELAAEKCHLHLWTTNGFLFECPRIFEAWGFEFKSSFVWVKPQMGIGNYWRCSHEILLLAVRGGLTAQDKGQKSWAACPRGEHSAKPDIIREAVEKLSPGPYLELFGRGPRDRWTVFGNQVSEAML